MVNTEFVNGKTWCLHSIVQKGFSVKYWPADGVVIVEEHRHEDGVMKSEPW